MSVGKSCRLLITYLLWGLSSGGAWANLVLVEPSSMPTTLKQVFAAAWLRQPETRSRQTGQEAAFALRDMANSWTAEPVSRELSVKTEGWHTNQDPYEAGHSLTLCMPDERAQRAAVARTEERVTFSRVLTAQWPTAATVGEAHWQWPLAASEHALALERLANTQPLAADRGAQLAPGARTFARITYSVLN